MKKAQQLLEYAISLSEDQNDEAIKIYDEILKLRSDWSAPYFNLGLIYKYRLEWDKSLYFNEQSIKFGSNHEGGWWNLGIAATALKKWRIAREAWLKCGVTIDINEDEPNMCLGNTPIRINPDAKAEVVWAKRIDPARATILNIPFPSSGHKFGDMVLNDGAAQGYKIVNEIDYPVFNELQVIRRSDYKTYSCKIYTSTLADIEKLERICEEYNVEMEDWSTVRYYCRQCSEGIVHEQHDHNLKAKDGSFSNIGFAAIDQKPLEDVLKNWRMITLCDHDEIVLELE